MRILTLAIIVSLQLTSFAIEKITLVDAYQLAYENDPAFLAKKYELEAKLQKNSQALALLLPGVSFETGYTTSKSSTDYYGSNPYNYPDQKQQYETWNGSISINQVIYNKETFTKYDIQLLELKNAEIIYRLAEHELLLNISLSYIKILNFQELLSVNKQQSVAYNEQYNNAQEKYNLGEGTIIDLEESKAKVDQSYSELITIENQLNQARNELSLMTLEFKDAIPIEKIEKIVKTEMIDLDYWSNKVNNKSLHILQSKLQLEMARNDLKFVGSQDYPTVGLYANYSVADSSGNSIGLASRNQQYTAGIKLNYQIYKGGMIESQKIEKHILVRRAEMLLKKQEYTTHTYVKNEYGNILSAQENIVSSKAALASSKIAFEATQKGYDIGVRTSMDLLNAQKEFFERKKDLLKSRYQLLTSYLKLQYISGDLSIEDLAIYTAN